MVLAWLVVSKIIIVDKNMFRIFTFSKYYFKKAGAIYFH